MNQQCWTEILVADPGAIVVYSDWLEEAGFPYDAQMARLMPGLAEEIIRRRERLERRNRDAMLRARWSAHQIDQHAMPDTIEFRNGRRMYDWAPTWGWRLGGHARANSLPNDDDKAVAHPAVALLIEPFSIFGHWFEGVMGGKFIPYRSIASDSGVFFRFISPEHPQEDTR